MDVKNALKSTGLDIIKTSDIMGEREEYIKPSDGFGIVKPMTFTVKKGTREAAVKLGIIPEAYKDCSFDIDRIKSNIVKQNSKTLRKFRVKRFNDYQAVSEGLISTIISNKIPDRSYLIGAPNGFGKTSLANTCIAMLYQQGKVCVPYISLSELAEIRLAEQRQIASGLTSRTYYNRVEYEVSTIQEYFEACYGDFESLTYKKEPINILGKFSWSEYMEASVLFCYFTDVTSKVLESEMLKTILTIRGTKGLPTVVFISTSLQPYTGDEYLYNYVWNDILESDKEAKNYDRVIHISCWKDFNSPLERNIGKES